GFVLVWADNDTAESGTGGDLHAGFQLSATGEAIGLFAPDGTPQASVTFGQQFQNVSQGLFPDGKTNAVYFMTNFTPRASNVLEAPLAPQVKDISVNPNGTVSITFDMSAYKRYRIELKNRLEDNWTTLGSEKTAF